MTNVNEEHWRFSLRFYGERDVSYACIVLQDRCGVDVNVLLLSLYATLSLNRVHDDQDIEAMDNGVRILRDQVIEPLRHVRRHIKGKYSSAGENIRQLVKQSELLAERLEQSMLAETLIARDCPAQGGANVAAVVAMVVNYYLGIAGKQAGTDPEIVAAIGLIATAAESFRRRWVGIPSGR